MTPTNAARADFALVGLKAFAEHVYSAKMEAEDMEIIVSDFLCDLMHFCDQYNFDFDAALDMGRGHHEEERNDHE
jgi:hypothetical protein